MGIHPAGQTMLFKIFLHSQSNIAVNMTIADENISPS